MEKMDFDMEAKFGWHAQKLMTVKKERNYYQLESPDIEAMKGMDEEMKKAYMARDVDEMYKPDTGERILPACEMNEKIYLIVRSITNRNIKQPYVLKKSDIIKLGRVKFKVKDIFIAKIEKQRADKRDKMKRHEEIWHKKQLAIAK